MPEKMKIFPVLAGCLCCLLIDGWAEAKAALPTCKSLVEKCVKDTKDGCNVWSKVAALYNPRFVCQSVLDVIEPLTKDPSIDYLPGCIAGCGRAQVFNPPYCTGPCL
jgi:hypothetical protein